MQIHARQVLVVASLAASLLGRTAAPPSIALADGERLPVTIVDAPAGDTLTAHLEDGTTETVRLIGIDAPEPDGPGRPGRCFGAEAKARAGSLAAGQQAEIELDVSARDQHGRLLGYVWLPGQATSLNQQLLAEGFATPLTVAPNTTYSDDLKRAAKMAQLGKRGIWSACAVGEPPSVATEYPPGEVALTPDSAPTVQIQLGTERTDNGSQMTISVSAEGGQGIDQIVVSSDRADDPAFGAERQISCSGQTICSESWTVHPNHLGVYQVAARAQDAGGQAADANVSLNVVGRWQTIAARVADLRPSVEANPAPASPASATTAADSVAPVGTGTCPEGFPIKARTADDGSHGYVRPDDDAYAATIADRCFATDEAATAAGYTPRQP